jgi:hypothetical protein
VRRGVVLLLVLVPGLASACAGGGGGDSEMVEEVAVGLVTLQGGTISELKERRGRGPFRRYDLPPDALLQVVAEAAGRARGPDGRPLRTVWIRRRSMEVVAKEPAPDAKGAGYAEPWRSAMVAMVHPVPGDPAASRLEIHAMDKGPFHRGRVDWERSLPGWIDEVLAAPQRTPGGLKPLP